MKIRTAMILAAGFGTRMKNLTRETPKPLLPLSGKSILEILIEKLGNAGIETVVINLHYQAGKIMKHLSGKFLNGPRIRFSVEKEHILGTGGGIAFAEKFFADETILTANADVLSDIPLQSLFKFCDKRQPLASMTVLPVSASNEYSLVVYDDQLKIKGFNRKGERIPTNKRAGIFTGFQILTPQARSYLRPVYSSIIDALYKPAISEAEKILAFPFHDTWLDAGTKQRYLKIKQQFEAGTLHLKDFTK